MAHITKVKLSNVKKFKSFETILDPLVNTLIGDNEAGKSTILTAIELVLSGSTSKVDTLGLEALLNADVVSEFLGSAKNITDLPTLHIEIYLSQGIKPELNGRVNSDGVPSDGLQLICEPNDELSSEIQLVLDNGGDNFPYEFYVAKFTTFSGESYSGYRKFMSHLSIDSTQINNEYANNVSVRQKAPNI
jgi:hypothetical protein